MSPKAKKKTTRKAARAKSPARKRVSPVPKGYGPITPHLVVEGGSRALDVYKRGLGAKVKSKMAMPDGRLMHAELVISGSHFMLADDFPEWRGGAHRTPTRLGETTVTLHLYVPNADAAFQRAIDAGFTVAMPLADMFWGDRYGQVKDPFGHVWAIATRKIDLTPKQMEKAAMAAMAEMGRH